MEMSSLCLVLLAVTLGVHSQTQYTQRRSDNAGDCPIPNAATIDALLPESFNLADGAERPTVTVSEFIVVCQAPGLRRDTVSSFSVVVSYSCTGGPTACDGNSRTDQFQYDCSPDNTTTTADVGAVRREDVTFDLDPPRQLNEDCGQCLADTGLLPSDPLDHCVACLQDCSEGQRRCVGASSDLDRCCNWYLEGRCVVQCPGELQGDEDPGTIYDCGCGELDLQSGSVSYTNRFAVGSVATHTCDEDLGYVLSGNSNQRTCDRDVEGWTGDPITCELHNCGNGDLERPENGDILNSDTAFPTTFGSVVTFVCNDKFLLKGDMQRTCTLEGWSGENPTCESESTPPVPEETAKPEENRSACGTACIVGIVVAILAVIVLAAVLAGVGYAIYSYMNNPDTKLAKLDPNGINGVARDNPLYVDPDAVVGAEATDAVVGAEAA